MSRPLPSAAQVAEKWARKMSTVQQDYQAGVEAVQESPMEAAANAQDRYLAAVQESVSSGKYARNLRNVSLAEWKRKATTVGAQRIAQGAAAARGTYENRIGAVLQHIQAGQANLPPRGDLAANIQRMTQMVEHMARFES